jgi:fructokinase
MSSKNNTEKRETVAAFGEVLWDLLPDGAVLGGAPFNFAYRINTLGNRGIMISRVGNDALGKKAITQMQSLGIDTEHIQRDEQYPTGTVEIMLDEARNPDYTIIEEVAYDHIESTAEVLRAVKKADSFCFGTLAQREERSAAALREMLGVFQGNYCIYDINLRKNCYNAQNIEYSLQQANILKLNEDETAELSRIYGIPDNVLPDFAAGLIEKTDLKYVLITLGERGVIACSNNGERVYVPGFLIDLADPCGSGDAFTAAFLDSLLKKRPLGEACRYGNALGALVAAQNGATGMIDPGRLEAFVQEREAESIDERFAGLMSS